ncbi:gamma-glutamyl-gamma-aminobutyrate hydrolase family protein [Nakamurella leprariae]|uniref:Gamma-glutamyl-gamma-aminobutyrate hydrolase family protein n=1 Tax=Nakamurella leprariae TaxID=2803911 RepID=A0A938Y8U2_9ACTN|nr:gamma-glutamyl-gamma-aminobutyrate hydrolase family protein [Nakamurella leprariae]MBM9467955.1 gamma-glutamyl-gamma-aminobutyrate hydrolase family protein [Nakamurella leprariae]
MTLSTRHHVRSRPVIGLTGRRTSAARLGAPPGFWDAQADAYYSEYARSVAHAGGLPFHISLDAAATDVGDVIDALVLTGGDDVEPSRYGSTIGPRSTAVDPDRDAFEIALFEAVLRAGKPILGICRGSQLINVALGGTLVSDLPLGEGASHASYAFPRAHRRHAVRFEVGSRAHEMYGDLTSVNSFHHQAVDRVGSGLTVTGRAEDGVVEAIEMHDAPVLGVQWHPECFASDPVFDWLVHAARSDVAAAG